MSAEAELIITPDIARTELNKAMRDIEKTFKETSVKVQKDFEKAITKGSGDGAESASKRIGKALKAGYKKTAGLRRAVSGGIVGLATAGLFDAIDRADSAGNMIAGLLGGENQATRSLALAESAGMSPAEFAQISQNLRAGGLTEQEDINAIVFDVNARVGEAIAGEDPLLRQFGQYEGAERMNRIFAALATGDETQALMMLDKLGFSSDAPEIISMLRQNRGSSYEETYANLSRVTSSATAEATKLQTESEKAELFRKAQTKHQQKWQEKFLNEINEGDISTYFTEQDRVAEAQKNLLTNYTDNMKAATLARTGIATAMATLNEFTRKITAAVEGLHDRFVDKADPPEVVKRRENIEKTKKDLESNAEYQRLMRMK